MVVRPRWPRRSNEIQTIRLMEDTVQVVTEDGEFNGDGIARFGRERGWNEWGTDYKVR